MPGRSRDDSAAAAMPFVSRGVGIRSVRDISGDAAVDEVCLSAVTEPEPPVGQTDGGWRVAMILLSTYPDVVLPTTFLPGFLFDQLSIEDSGRLAVVDTATGSRYTYGRLAAAVDDVAAALAERGIGRGDVVALAVPNCAEYPALLHGALRAGAAVSPANPRSSARELTHQLRDAGARLLFTFPAGLDRARVAARDSGIGEIIVLGAPLGRSGIPLETEFADFVATEAPVPDIVVSGAELAALPYSSGTTGVPKGVRLTHRDLVANLRQVWPLTRMRAGSRVLVVLPLYHVHGLTGIMNHILERRATMVTMPRFDLETLLRTIAEERIDHLFIAPPTASALASSPLVDDHDLSSVDVVVSASAPLDGDLAQAVAKRLDATVVRATS